MSDYTDNTLTQSVGMGANLYNAGVRNQAEKQRMAQEAVMFPIEAQFRQNQAVMQGLEIGTKLNLQRIELENKKGTAKLSDLFARRSQDGTLYTKDAETDLFKLGSEYPELVSSPPFKNFLDMLKTSRENSDINERNKVFDDLKKEQSEILAANPEADPETVALNLFAKNAFGFRSPEAILNLQKRNLAEKKIGADEKEYKAKAEALKSRQEQLLGGLSYLDREAYKIRAKTIAEDPKLKLLPRQMDRAMEALIEEYKLKSNLYQRPDTTNSIGQKAIDLIVNKRGKELTAKISPAMLKAGKKRADISEEVTRLLRLEFPGQ